MKNPNKEPDEFTDILTLVIGIVVIGLAVTFLIRFQRGLLGVILSGVAVVLLTFWLKEARGLLRRRPWIRGKAPGRRRELSTQTPIKEELWTYDFYEADEETVLVAKVPGPEEDIQVDLSNTRLKIRGGQGFTKKLSIPKKSDISRVSYKNGVLEVRFKKK